MLSGGNESNEKMYAFRRYLVNSSEVPSGLFFYSFEYTDSRILKKT